MKMEPRIWIVAVIAVMLICLAFIANDIIQHPEGARSDKRDTPLAH